MSPETEKLIAAIGKTLTEAKELTIEQLPLVARELLVFNIITDFIGIFVLIAMISGLYYEYKKVIDELRFFILLIGVLLTLLLIGYVDDIFKIILAPRLYLLDYIKRG